MKALNQHQEALAQALGLLEHKQKAASPIDTGVFSGNGGLSQDLADAFIDLVVDETALMQAMRLFRTNSNSGEIAKLDVQGVITEQASENTDSTETRKPINTLLEFTTKKTRSQFDITGEVEEDNIEGSGGKGTILNALLKAVRNDMENLIIQGDASISATDDTSRLLKTNDGLTTLTSLSAGTQIKSAGAKRVSWALLRDMLKQLPTRYRGNLQSYRWIMSANTVIDLAGEAEERATNLGDLMWQQAAPPSPLGIPIMMVPLMPEDLTVTGTDSTGTIIWLVDPRNFIWVVQRDLVVHEEFKPRKDVTEVTAFMRTDILVENTDAVVKATNVVLDSAVARFS